MTTKTDTSQSVFVFVRDTNTGAIKRVAIPADVQVGLLGNPASLTLLGGFAVSTADISVDASNNGVINISNDDTVVAIDVALTPTTGRVSVFLPPGPRDGQLHFIKDSTGTAGTVPIDIIPPPGTLIDGKTTQSLVDVFGSMAVFWFRGAWRVLVSGVGITNIGGASASGSYITANPEPGLTNERHFVASTNISVTDDGPGSDFFTDLTDTTVVPGTYAAATIVVDQKGRITAAVANVPPNPSASYITVTNESILPNERALSGSIGIKLFDNGPNSSLSVSINDNDVATLTGSTFRGPVVAGGGLSGSLQNLTNGLSYLVAGANIIIATASNGQIVISSTASGSSSGSGGGTVIVSGTIALSSASLYSGFTTSPIFWTVDPTTWNPITGAVNNFTDTLAQSISRVGSTFTINDPGAYGFHASFNAYGSDAYITLRLSGAAGTVLQRGTYRSTPIDQNPVVLDGIFNNAFASGSFSLQYVASGTVFPWTGSALPASETMRTGEITIYRVASVLTGSAQPQIPTFVIPILAGSTTTNIASVSQKQSLGTVLFNPSLLNHFNGTKRYFYRAIVDTIETPVSAAIDLYDINAIVTSAPGIITGSIMSSSNLILSQIQVELTSQLASVTGSGIFESRLWRTSTATLTSTSSITCYGARLEVEFN